jgi:hypothetical protein
MSMHVLFVKVHLDRQDGKKVYLSGSATDEAGRRIASARALFYQLWHAPEEETDDTAAEADVRRRELFRQLLAQAKECPYPMSDEIAQRGRVCHVFDSLPLLTDLLKGGYELDTPRVLALSRFPALPHLTRGSGQVRAEYLWNAAAESFVAVAQFTGWVQGPPGNVHGGCLCSMHIDACEAAVLSRYNELFSSLYPSAAVPPQPVYPAALDWTVRHVHVNYRRFTPLEASYLVVVTPLAAQEEVPAVSRSRQDIAEHFIRVRSECFSEDEQTGARVVCSDAVVTFSVLPSDHGSPEGGSTACTQDPQHVSRAKL